MSWSILCCRCNKTVDTWMTIGTSDGIEQICIECFIELMDEHDKDINKR